MPLDNPARMIRLITSMIEGGNEPTATRLRQSSGLTIDVTCSVVVLFLVKSEKSQKKPKGGGNIEPLTQAAILKLFTTANSVGAALLALVIEQFFVLPLNADQLNSPTVWEFLEKAVVPCMAHLAKSSTMNATEAAACSDFMDITERIFISLVRLGLFNGVLENKTKEMILSSLADDAETMLSNRRKPPEFLRAAFVAECEKLDSQTLDLEQFVSLMEKISTTGASKSEKTMTKRRRKELEQAFESADVDGNGCVNLYEFEALYVKVNPTRRASVVQRANEALKGLKLSSRTVECAERIIAIRRGEGNELGSQRYTRNDSYGRRKQRQSSRGDHGRLSTAIFGSAEVSAEAAKAAIRSRKKGSESGKLQDKLELFQMAVFGNPSIQSVIKRQRFDLVRVLERGVPGPPPAPKAAPGALRFNGIAPIAVPTSPKPVAPPLKRPLSWNRSSSKVVPAPPVLVSPVVPLKKVSLSMVSAKKASNLTTDEEIAAALLIQAFFKRHQAAQIQSSEAVEAHKSAHKRHTLPGDHLLGAVELSWMDLTQRFVRYVSEHFFETGNGFDTCKLIFETWVAHLIKARTWAFTADGKRTGDISKAESLKLCAPEDLDEAEAELYVAKQLELSNLGVTTLLARVIASLAEKLGDGDLPDVAIELMVEVRAVRTPVSTTT